MKTKSGKVDLQERIAFSVDWNKVPKGEKIYKDHEELVEAIEQKDKAKAREIALRHMERYVENIDTIKAEFPDYFQKIE